MLNRFRLVYVVIIINLFYLQLPERCTCIFEYEYDLYIICKNIYFAFNLSSLFAVLPQKKFRILIATSVGVNGGGLFWLKKSALSHTLGEKRTP